MNWAEILQISGAVAVLGVALGAGIGGFWYAFKSKDNKLLHEQLKETKDAVDRCEAKHVESERAVSNLQGQIDVLKNIPLARIDTSLERIADYTSKTLETLKNSAIIVATDRDTLLGGAHISEQHVEHQHVDTVHTKKGKK